MSEVILKGRRREVGRSIARQLRRESQVPGVYYFHGEEPISIVTAELALRPLIFTTESHLVRLQLDDGVEKTCILKDISFDPMTDRPTHFDLLGVAADEKIRVEVPVNLVGQSIGSRNGGIVDLILHKLEVECLPKYLPDHIDVNVTEMNIGDSIHVADLNLDNVTVITQGDLNIVSIAAPRTDDGSSDTTAAAEPELVAKKPTDE